MQAELSFENVKNADKIREQLLSLVARYRADQTGLSSKEAPKPVHSFLETPESSSDKAIAQSILEELKAIRIPLERRTERESKREGNGAL